jgi:DNA-binding NarL/FixJ family response regulator
MIRVAVFDDNARHRQALRLLIDSTDDMTCVAAFEDCRDVVSRLEACNPAVVLMDIDMPHVNGIQGVELIRDRFSDVRIIMQTVFEDEDKILAAVCAGADGYFLKKTAPEDMLRGIKEVMEGGAPMSPSVARKVLLFSGARERGTPMVSMGLSEREQEVLSLLAKGHSYKMIGEQLHIAMGTVNGHVRKIYEKLQVHSVAGAVGVALKRGLV